MKFSDFGNVGKKSESPGVPYEGTFGCQHCDRVVDEARYLPEQALMVWDCAMGHRSFMEWKI